MESLQPEDSIAAAALYAKVVALVEQLIAGAPLRDALAVFDAPAATDLARRIGRHVHDDERQRERSTTSEAAPYSPSRFSRRGKLGYPEP